MKGWLRHLPLRAMLRAFAGDHALAQQHFCSPHCAFFDEVVVLHDQHFADVVGVIQEDDVVPSDFVVRDVAVFLGQMLKQQDGIRRTKPAEGEPEQIALEAGRKAVCRGAETLLAGTLCRAAVAIFLVYLLDSIRRRKRREFRMEFSWEYRIRWVL